jgi:activating signal cointegrator complex subunit 1
MVSLERALPYDIQAGTNVVRFLQRPAEEPFESGVEGLTFAFRHEPYNGHHLVSASCAACPGRLLYVPCSNCRWSAVVLRYCHCPVAVFAAFLPPTNSRVQEKGWNAVEFKNVHDCWARDIATVNADNGILLNSACWVLGAWPAGKVTGSV